jgi:CRISPR-associated Csx2 family protein
MSNILITTLGKGHRNEDGYVKTKYRLGENESIETPFIGQALIELIPEIDKVVVLGTTGSIWDAWWQTDEALLERYTDFLAKLNDNVQRENDDLSALSELADILTAHLKKEVQCKYIPDGFDEESQLNILQVIDNIGAKGDDIYLDVTHGFRHLPMIELLSAFLKRNDFNVRKIYYGAFERSANGVTPIIDLKGLFNIQEWIEAMAVFRETGNVMPLSRIESMKGFQVDLEQYQFFIQMNNIGNARGCANRIRGKITNGDIPTEAILFKDQLMAIFDWGKDQEYANRQLSQAKRAAQSGDFLRAIILLNEAVISAWVEDSSKVADIQYRKEAEDKLFKNGGDNWHILRRLRNSTAHDGMKNDRLEKKIKAMKSSRSNFEKGFGELLKWAEKNMR